MGLADARALLESSGRYASDRRDVPWRGLLAWLAAGGFGYGLVMGYFAGRLEQALYSALKVPMLLGVSTLVCVPNFFVVNSVLGLRDDFAAACRGVVAAQATLSLVLASCVPLTALAYVSSADYNFATAFNGVIFLVASIAGQVTLSRHYAPLIAGNPRHRIGRRAWLGLYVFVAIQLAWMLRPFVGSPHLPPQFLREEAWDNAYVVVFRVILDLFS